MQNFAKFHVVAVSGRKSLFWSDVSIFVDDATGEEAIVCYIARQIPGSLHCSLKFAFKYQINRAKNSRPVGEPAGNYDAFVMEFAAQKTNYLPVF